MLNASIPPEFEAFAREQVGAGAGLNEQTVSPR
jgi:hypothetical protein